MFLPEDLIQGPWLCRLPCDPIYHAYDLIIIMFIYLYTKLGTEIIS